MVVEELLAGSTESDLVGVGSDAGCSMVLMSLIPTSCLVVVLCLKASYRFSSSLLSIPKSLDLSEWKRLPTFSMVGAGQEIVVDESLGTAVLIVLVLSHPSPSSLAGLLCISRSSLNRFPQSAFQIPPSCYCANTLRIFHQLRSRMSRSLPSGHPPNFHRSDYGRP